MLTGHGWGGKSTGSTFSDLKYATDRGIAVMYLPPARKWAQPFQAHPSTLASFLPRKPTNGAR
jgi:hypothetical protein